MPARKYNWKRFWVRREGQLSLADGGYLSDPESDWGRIENNDVRPFDAIANTPCLILLGGPGIGKSSAMESEYGTANDGTTDQKFLLDLRSIGSEERLTHKLFENEKFRNWLQGNHRMYLFLDSLDECLLRIDTLASLLIEELGGCPVDRLSLRIACRTGDWPNYLEEGLLQLWGKDSVAAYELAPLRRRDVREAAENNGMDPGMFLREVDRVGAVPLAIKPATLGFLLNTYGRSAKLPMSQTELYSKGCRILCEEMSESRRGARQYGILSPNQRMGVASRIAAVMIFANKFAVWTGPDVGNVHEEDIPVRDLSGGTETVDGVSVEINETAIREAIATGLFTSHGPERMGWAHLTYAEFLAAKYLTDKRMALTQMMSLIAHSSDPEKKLVPQLHETAAWLAGMNQDVFNEIMRTDPDVLLRSDVATADNETKQRLVEALLRLIENEELLDVSRQHQKHYVKLKHPDLQKQLRPLLEDSSKSLFVRRTAIDIAKTCELKELQEALALLALDIREQISLRIEAAHAIYRMGDSATKAKLMPLARGDAGEDPEDRLKGWGLHAIWPDHIAVDELFSMITTPKRGPFVGSYQYFLKHELAKHLYPSSLPPALNWAEKDERRQLGSDPFEKLKDGIMLKAWELIDSPGVLEGFARIAFARLKNHDPIVRNDHDLAFQKMVAQDDHRRRTLLEAIIHIIATNNAEAYHIIYSTTRLALDKDLQWIIERLQVEGSKDSEIAWARLLKASFRWGGDVEQVKTILNGCREIPILAEVFEDLLKPVVLDSEEAKTLKRNYRMMTESGKRERPLLDPPPSVRIASRLDDIESGTLEAWWILNMDMTLEPNSTHYGDEFNSDLTALPGWNIANEETRGRIIRAACVYVLEAEPTPEEWLGKNIFHRPSYAGVRALRLLRDKDPAFIEDLPSATWKKWASAILAGPWSGGADDSEIIEALVKKAYDHAPEEIIHALDVMIDKEDGDHGHIFTMGRVKDCWNERLAKAVLDKSKNDRLKPSSVGDLFGELVGHKVHEAYEFIRSLLHQQDTERQKTDLAFFAAKALISGDPKPNWPYVWPLLREDERFGKKVLESVSYEDRSAGAMMQALSENQLAELYVWLSRKYPHAEDPKHDGAYTVGPRDSIAHWRDELLRNLELCGTPEACKAIHQIMAELSHLSWLKWTLLNARAATRQKTWTAPSPKDVLEITKNSETRLVQDGEQLLSVIIESLIRLERKLHGHTPSVVFLWDEVEKGVFKPKDEGKLSDFVKIHLDQDLRQRGIIVNREVEIRRITGGIGERTDIHIDALKKGSRGEIYDRITVVVEVKGCWNRELNSAMETQLFETYMDEAQARHGLYLVGWFNCDRWASDYRKGNTPSISVTEARTKFEAKAAENTRNGKVMRAFILDTALQ